MTQFSKFKIIFLLILYFGLFGLAKSSQAVYPVAGRRKFLFAGFFLIFIIFFAGLTLVPPAYGATINAADCSETAINAAISSASKGDSITIKNGTSCSATWTGTINLASKEIKLIGGGKNITQITGGAIQLGSNTRLTGLSLDTVNIATAEYTDMVNFRIDHNLIKNGTGCCHLSMIISGNSNIGHRFIIPYGLIDSNEFETAYILINGLGWPENRDSASTFWSLPTNWGGGNDAVYIENNKFSGVASVDAEYGARFVFRFNNTDGAPWVTHGVQSTENRPASRMEGYNNIFNNTGAAQFFPIAPRGGQLLLFNNTIAGNWTNSGIEIDNQTSTRYGDYGQAGCSVLNYSCSGSTINGPANPRDGNRAGLEGYPCRDQFGRGQDNELWVYEDIINISNSNPAVVTYNGGSGNADWRTLLENGMSININNAGGMNEINGHSYTIANLNTSANTFELQGVNSSTYGTYSGGGSVYGSYSQALSPFYSWNNKSGGNDVSRPIITAETPFDGCQPSNPTRYLIHLKADRDYYYSTSMQVSKGAPFNGTTGVGYGLLAYRPDTCDPLPVATGVADEPGGGVAYWATDTKTLYRCSARNTWSTHFTPFTCPHPLAGLIGSCDLNIAGTAGYNIGSVDASPPSAPQGLSVQ